MLQFSINLRDRTQEIAPISNFETAFEGYIRALFIVAALATFFYMLWGAFDWITAGGESGKVESARKKITQAIIGLAVLASTAAIFLAVQSFLGVGILFGGSSGNRGTPAGQGPGTGSNPGGPNVPPIGPGGPNIGQPGKTPSSQGTGQGINQGN